MACPYHSLKTTSIPVYNLLILKLPILIFPDLLNDHILFDEKQKQICWVKVAKSAIVRVQFGRTAM